MLPDKWTYMRIRTKKRFRCRKKVQIFKKKIVSWAISGRLRSGFHRSPQFLETLRSVKSRSQTAKYYWAYMQVTCGIPHEWSRTHQPLCQRTPQFLPYRRPETCTGMHKCTSDHYSNFSRTIPRPRTVI